MNHIYVSAIYLSIASGFYFFLVWRARMLWLQNNLAQKSEEYPQAVRARDNFGTHGNWVFIMMIFSEVQGGNPYIIHLLGISICVSKFLYFYIVFKGSERLLLVAKTTKIAALAIGIAYTLILANPQIFK